MHSAPKADRKRVPPAEARNQVKSSTRILLSTNGLPSRDNCSGGSAPLCNAASATGVKPPPPVPLPRSSGEGVLAFAPPLPETGSGGARGGVGRSSEASVGRSLSAAAASSLRRGARRPGSQVVLVESHLLTG